MASTGVVVDDNVVTQFNEVKLGRTKAKFLIYVINDGKIFTEHVAETSSNFQEFVNMLPPNDCRYAIYDMDFTTNDGRPNNKLVFIAW